MKRKIILLCLTGALLCCACACRSESTQFTPGKTEANCYRSDFLGLQCTLEENWRFLTDAEIAQFKTDAAENASAGGDYFIDLYAMRNDGGASISITLQNLAAYDVRPDEAAYLEQISQQLQQAMTHAGLTDAVCGIQTIDFLDRTRDCVAAQASSGDRTVYEAQICIGRSDYMAVVTLISNQEDLTQQLADAFAPL